MLEGRGSRVRGWWLVEPGRTPPLFPVSCEEAGGGRHVGAPQHRLSLGGQAGLCRLPSSLPPLSQPGTHGARTGGGAQGR